jgi:ring-1,2-phenylacetyl-CoA epoxidase subunit PaaD
VAALEAVMDPEIPVVSVIDMGMIGKVDVNQDGVVEITLLPTFSGCPAVHEIKQDIVAAVAAVPGVGTTLVKTSFDPPWTTDRITTRGRLRLKEFGLSPPTGEGPVLVTAIGLPPRALCPFCDGTDTVAESPFGPTPCRALYYCKTCRNPFEQFKPV